MEREVGRCAWRARRARIHDADALESFREVVEWPSMVVEESTRAVLRIVDRATQDRRKSEYEEEGSEKVRRDESNQSEREKGSKRSEEVCGDARGRGKGGRNEKKMK